MKLFKSIFIVGLLMVSGVVKSHAWNTTGGEINGNAIYKSSDINHNAVNAFISTGYIALAYIQVTSPGINSNIVFQEALSTNAAFGFPTFYGSSVPHSGAGARGIATTRDVYGDGMKYLMQRSTFGWVFTTTGDVPARLRIFWGYITPPNK